jgi:hypothetical protein
VKLFDYQIGNQAMTLVDTLGLDDTYTSNQDTLKEIAEWLKKTYDGGRLLNGILYLQPITKNRAEGSSLRSLSLLGKTMRARKLPQCVACSLRSGTKSRLMLARSENAN